MATLTFDEAAKKVTEMKTPISEDKKLKLYGLYKQVNTGDINIDQPYMIQIEARKKYNAWLAVKGKSKEDAQKEYIAYVQELLAADK